DLFDLSVFQFDRGRATEDRNFDLEARTLLVDILHGPIEGRVRTILNTDLLAHLEADRRFRTLDTLLDLTEDAISLIVRDRHRLAVGTEETGHLRGILDEVVSLVGQVRPHQHIAGEELALRINLAAATNLDDLLGRHEDLLEKMAQALLASLLLDRLRNLLLKIRICVDDVPTRRHLHLHRSVAYVEHEAHQPANQLVGSEEKQCSENNHQQDHRRGDHRLTAGRPGNLRAFSTDLLQELDRIGLGSHRISTPLRHVKLISFSPTHRVSVFPYINTSLSFNKRESCSMNRPRRAGRLPALPRRTAQRKELAGAAGLEPTTCGFGDRRSTN